MENQPLQSILVGCKMSVGSQAETICKLVTQQVDIA